MPSLKIRGRQAATTLEPATAGAPVPNAEREPRRSASSPSATSSDATPAASSSCSSSSAR